MKTGIIRNILASNIIVSKSGFPLIRGIIGVGTFTNIEDQGIVEILFSGEMTEEDVISSREVAAKIAAEQEVKNFLVDVRPSTLKPSNSAVYDHGPRRSQKLTHLCS